MNDRLMVEKTFSIEKIPSLYGFDLQTALIFIAVVETGSLTVSARMLNLSVSIVSLKLKKFRRNYDVELFTREGRDLVSTHEGHLLNNKLKAWLQCLFDSPALVELSVCFKS